MFFVTIDVQKLAWLNRSFLTWISAQWDQVSHGINSPWCCFHLTPMNCEIEVPWDYFISLNFGFWGDEMQFKLNSNIHLDVNVLNKQSPLSINGFISCLFDLLCLWWVHFVCICRFYIVYNILYMLYMHVHV